MKLFLSWLALVGLWFGFGTTAYAQSYEETSLSQYWKSRNRYRAQPTNIIRRTVRRVKPSLSSSRQRVRSARQKRARTSIRPSTASVIRQRRRAPSQTTYKRRQSQSRGVSRLTGDMSLPTTAVVSVRSLRQRQAVKIIDQAEIPLFRLGVSHRKNYKTTDFLQAANLKRMRWSILDSEGTLTDDLTQFSLVVNGGSFPFEEDGTVNLYLPEYRLSVGETKAFDIGLRIQDSSRLPHLPGTLQIQLESIMFGTETGKKEIPVVIRGNKVSQKIVFDPVPIVNAASVFAGYSHQIYGRSLSAGEEEFVLAVNFQAHYDDFVIDSLTVTEQLSGGDVDHFIDRIQAVDLKTGQVVDESRFLNGRAHFDLSTSIFVPRNGERRIGFRVRVEDSVRVGTLNTNFKLNLLTSGVDVRGLGSGKEVPESQKNFSVQADTFFVTGGQITLRPAQNNFSLAVTDNLAPIYRFVIENGGARDVSLGRISFHVRLGGLKLTGDGVPDDLAIRRVINGNEVSLVEFDSLGMTGDIVHFDALNEVLVPRKSRAEYVLKARLSEKGTASNNDSVGVQILGDSSRQVGRLSQVRTGSTRFVWSDHSGRPHSTSSEDWMSGYFVDGLPTNTVVNYRR